MNDIMHFNNTTGYQATSINYLYKYNENKYFEHIRQWKLKFHLRP